MPSHQENLTVLAQFEDRERAPANSWGETLQSGMCHRLPTTKVLSALRLWYPPVVRAMASALLGKSPPEAHDFPEASLGRSHVNVCGTVHHLPPSPAVQFRQIMFSFLRKDDNRCSPKSLPPLKPFDYGTHSELHSFNSFIHSTMLMGRRLLLWSCDPFLISFIHSFVQQYLTT